jgi:hypothetical protein
VTHKGRNPSGPCHRVGVVGVDGRRGGLLEGPGDGGRRGLFRRQRVKK